MNKKALTLLVPMLALTLGSCGNKPIDDDDDTNHSDTITEEESVSQEEDIVGIIPQEVLNANCNIDVLLYIVGQNGTINNAGRQSSQRAEDVPFVDLAKYVAAARAFKRLAPGVNINLIWCSSENFNSRINDYTIQNGHYPHIMHPVDNFYEMAERGIALDLSKYEDSEYYQSYNEVFLDACTYGNFVAAFPTHYAPYGMFVNKQILRDHYYSDIVDDEDAYKDWVDNLTFEEFIDICKETYTPNSNAGFGHLFPDMISCMIPELHPQYAKDGTIDFTTERVKKLIELEQELAPYSVYDYPNPTNSGKADDGFAAFKTWFGNENFVRGAYTFNLESPWNIGYMCNVAKANGIDYKTMDFIPYPKADADTDQLLNIAVGGVTLGNQCPIDASGKENCARPTSHLEEDVAAYFTMFMTCDPRAIEAESEIEYMQGSQDTDDVKAKGDMSLPLIRRNYRFSWQDDPEKVAALGGDPSADFADNWSYQLSLYLKNYDTYWNTEEDDEPDVINFSNVNYGFTRIIDMVENEPQNVFCNRHTPKVVYESSFGGEIDILDNWTDRYNLYGEGIGSATYVSQIEAKLSELTDYVNERSSLALIYLQERLDAFYEEGKYNVLN